MLQSFKGEEQDSLPNGIVYSVVKAMKVLQCFNEKTPEWGLAQLCQELNMPKSTLLNLLKTLELGGYLAKVTNTQNYRLGMSLFELGYVVKSSMPIIQHAIPIMETIQEKTGEIVYFTVPRNGKVLYLEGVYPGKRTIHYSVAGRVLHMHCTGVGKAMLTYLTDEVVKEIVDFWGMPTFTPQTISNYEGLMKVLSLNRERGYAIDIEEESPGVKCVAVPIRTAHNEVLGAMSISGSLMSMTDSKIPEYAGLLMSACNILAQKANLFPAPSFLPKII
jgi:DNA-binding IclR family transcriptional regulator